MAVELDRYGNMALRPTLGARIKAGTLGALRWGGLCAVTGALFFGGMGMVAALGPFKEPAARILTWGAIGFVGGLVTGLVLGAIIGVNCIGLGNGLHSIIARRVVIPVVAWTSVGAAGGSLVSSLVVMLGLPAASTTLVIEGVGAFLAGLYGSMEASVILPPSVKGAIGGAIGGAAFGAIIGGPMEAATGALVGVPGGTVIGMVWHARALHRLLSTSS